QRDQSGAARAKRKHDSRSRTAVANGAKSPLKNRWDRHWRPTTDEVSYMVSTPLATLVLSIAPLVTLLRAQSPPASTVRLTLDQAIAVALERSPDAKLAQAAVDSARGESRVARSWPALSLASIPNTPFQYGATIPLDITPARIYRT